MIQRIRIRQRLLFVSFLVVEAVFIGLAIGAFFLPWTFDGQLAAVVGSLLLGLIAAFWFQPRLFYYAQMYGFVRLRAEAQPPRPARRDPFSPAFVSDLKEQGFAVFADDRRFVLLHRFTKDPGNLLGRATMLDMVLLMREADAKFDDPAIAATVRRLEADLAGRNHPARDRVLLQIRPGSVQTPGAKDEADQVTFEKQGVGGIAVVNALFDEQTKTVYFLHAPAYAPTVFYRYAVELMNTLV